MNKREKGPDILNRRRKSAQSENATWYFFFCQARFGCVNSITGEGAQRWGNTWGVPVALRREATSRESNSVPRRCDLCVIFHRGSVRHARSLLAPSRLDVSNKPILEIENTSRNVVFQRLRLLASSVKGMESGLVRLLRPNFRARHRRQVSKAAVDRRLEPLRTFTGCFSPHGGPDDVLRTY